MNSHIINQHFHNIVSYTVALSPFEVSNMSFFRNEQPVTRGKVRIVSSFIYMKEKSGALNHDPFIVTTQKKALNFIRERERFSEEVEEKNLFNSKKKERNLIELFSREHNWFLQKSDAITLYVCYYERTQPFTIENLRYKYFTCLLSILIREKKIHIEPNRFL